MSETTPTTEPTTTGVRQLLLTALRREDDGATLTTLAAELAADCDAIRASELASADQIDRLLAILRRHDGEFAELTRDRDQALADRDDLRQKLTRIVTSAGSRYEQLIVAARCASSGPDATADYWRWNGQAQVVREMTNEIARIASLEAPDWEGIKAAVPADGIYRATTKETDRA